MAAGAANQTGTSKTVWTPKLIKAKNEWSIDVCPEGVFRPAADVGFFPSLKVGYFREADESVAR
jgi:hypothetical protein